jgi:Tol biopolymer transport system component
MSDVFISHVEEDAKVALEIARGLNGAGYTTWCYEEDNDPGVSYLRQIGEAIEACHAVVLVISPESVGSDQVTREVEFSHDSRKRFVPVLKGISHVEFQNRRASWRVALGTASSIEIPPEGVSAILSRIVRGLQGLEVKPTGPRGAEEVEAERRAREKAEQDKREREPSEAEPLARETAEAERKTQEKADLKRPKRDTDSGRAVAAGLPRQDASGGVKPPLQGDSSDSQMIAALMKRHKKAIIALVAAGMVIAAALIYARYRAARLKPAPPAGLEFTRVTGSGDVMQADISPDGKYVAYVRETAGKQSLWLKQLATDSDVQIATLGEDHCPGLAFSPDGSYVYFVRQEPLKYSGDLYQVPSLGGTARKVLKEISGPPAFSPDGQRVAFVRWTGSENSSLLIASLDGSGERVLASYKVPESIVPDRASWSPDGKTHAFGHYGPAFLTTIAAEGGQAQPVAGAHWGQVLDLTWLPGSRDLLVAGSPLGAGGIQLYEVSLEGGEARQITHDLSLYTAVGISADGKSLLALQHQTLATLQVATPGKESEAHPLSAGTQNYDGTYGLAWTPDGKIVYFSVSHGRADLWEMGADGSNTQRLTGNDASSVSIFPAVSLRGGFIAFNHGDRTGQLNIWRMDMDGGNLKRLTEGKLDQTPAISPDGRWVIFSRIEGGKSFLMKVPSEGGPASQLTDYDSYFPSVSPDAKWIACYIPTQNQPARFAIAPFAGGQPAKVFPLPATTGFPKIVWTPDGRAISFINSENGVGNVWEQPVAGGPPKPVTHFTSDAIFCFDWSRDGRLALSRGTEPTDAVLIKNFR